MCEKYMDLFSAILSSLSPKLEIGTIKSRYSRTQERSYLSNGCFHCDALIGQFHEHEAGYGPIISYYGLVISCPVIEISERWRQAITADGREFGWGIYNSDIWILNSLKRPCPLRPIADMSAIGFVAPPLR